MGQEEQTRSALLRYYTSQVTSHAAYLLSLMIGFTQIFFSNPLIDFWKWIITEIHINLIINPKEHLVAIFFICLYFSGLSTYSILFYYEIGRTLWWGTHLNVILKVKPQKTKDIQINNSKIKATMHYRLDKAVEDYYKNTQKTGHLKFALQFEGGFKKLKNMYKKRLPVFLLIIWLVFITLCARAYILV